MSKLTQNVFSVLTKIKLDTQKLRLATWLEELATSPANRSWPQTTQPKDLWNTGTLLFTLVLSEISWQSSRLPSVQHIPFSLRKTLRPFFSCSTRCCRSGAVAVVLPPRLPVGRGFPQPAHQQVRRGDLQGHHRPLAGSDEHRRLDSQVCSDSLDLIAGYSPKLFASCW